MNDQDFIRELTRSPSHAALSGSDLQGLAKRASDMYLGQDTPLNDAVVKVASEHPGISPEQVNRVVEMTNAATFQRLFEKKAGDKNVQFEIADPAAVQRMLDFGASAPVMKIATQSYGVAPKRSRVSDIDADIKLASMFGVSLTPTEAMKTAGLVDPERAAKASMLLTEKEESAKAQKKLLEQLSKPLEPAPAPSPEQLGLNQGGQPQPAPMGAPQPQAAPGMGGMPKMSSADVFLELTGGAPNANGDIFTALTTPESPVETVKQAMDYLRLGRPGSELIKEDMAEFVSLDRIKEAARANDAQYDKAEPHADLYRAYLKLEKSANDINYAVDKNLDLWKTATAELGYQVIQHVLGGGNLGEVVHLMSGMGSADQVKTAMENVMPALERRLQPWEMSKIQADLVGYEMEKASSVRIVNPEHPIAQAFSGLIKAAEERPELLEKQAKVSEWLSEARVLMGQAAKTRVNS